MAFDNYSADRIRQYLVENKIVFYEKEMMGGLCFMVDHKMLCGLHFDKKRDVQILMVRVGETVAQEHLNMPGISPMDFTGRPMKAFLTVEESVLDQEEQLSYWLKLCLNFNPLAKRSKK